MTVALPSEPANYFHLLRRHNLDGIHRPLVVFTPKSMLRLKAATSAVEDFTEGKFTSVIDDPTQPDPASVRRLILCTGKIYYELAAHKKKHGLDDTAIVRLEQLYPLPHRKLGRIFDRYSNADDIRWVQEEPANQGAWPFLGLALPELFPQLQGKIKRVSRRAMAAPATGLAKVHEVEQAEVVNNAFA